MILTFQRGGGTEQDSGAARCYCSLEEAGRTYPCAAAMHRWKKCIVDRIHELACLRIVHITGMDKIPGVSCIHLYLCPSSLGGRCSLQERHERGPRKTY